MRGVLDHFWALLKAPHPHGIGPVLWAALIKKAKGDILLPIAFGATRLPTSSKLL
jgi:hypothetical protein